ncbi:MAG: hypothetical protein IPN02_07995 [Candidatus Microthrix sp.]|uniref:Uncharacterized protein n=1 Tax=Candidatus Neomicrothrix subdominans TaxID=2954438 RepID=A0A936TCQ7_9ACTN|nr:hypothetical protein [Candidatus Microthrix subdominans]
MANNCHLENAPCYLAAVVLDEDGFIVDGAPVTRPRGSSRFALRSRARTAPT